MNVKIETAILNAKESFFMAINAIKINKMRSFLTLLGIAVGVFSIIGVMTAMSVLLNSIESGMAELGAHTFQIQKFPAFGEGGPRERARYRNRKDISYENGVVVKDNTTLASAIGLESWEGGKVVKSTAGLKTNPEIGVAGEDVDGFTTNNWNIDLGRAFTRAEVNAGKHVTVIGKGVIDKLFQHTNPIGQPIRVDGKEFEVIGTIEEKGQMLGGNQSNFVVIPITTLFNEFGKDRSIHIMVQSTSQETYDDCVEQVRGILRTVRQVEPGAPDDFEIFSNDSLIAQFNDITKYVRLGIMLISAIALLAAGVGIMNIMLVSVTERTREIGIRKAIGARKRNILSQFIMEAIVLSEIGGIIGIVLGVILGNIIAFQLDVPPVIPWDWVAIGFIACSIVGVTFGVYPAWKASNLDPIESLRYE